MWIDEMKAMLPLLGHRNWILVVDKAFPWQNGEGIKLLDSGMNLPDALHELLGLLAEAPHIKPIVYCDKELEYLDDGLCPGIEALKSEIQKEFALTGRCAPLQSIKHDDIFPKIEEAAEMFKVVVIKTETLLPYTSVFFELDCGYWKGWQEKELRTRMNR